MAERHSQTSPRPGRSAAPGVSARAPLGRRNGDRRIADALAQRRRALLWDQLDVAERMGCSRTFVSELESGRKSPTVWTLRRWAEALDCDIAVVPRSEPPTPSEVDEVAVERARNGERVPLTKLERLAAMVDMDAGGLSAEVIAQRVGLSRRHVQRFQAGYMRRDVERLAKMRGTR